ncbi:MAG: 23S rRNA (uracil(1939)-C(5))-methyltransferase RlmD [Oligoflexales bacterium]|nr:23S rRNA (uracil(1939)-C(5))-methyltransferase RlmD [Oligoflexales bacterium]
MEENSNQNKPNIYRGPLWKKNESRAAQRNNATIVCNIKEICGSCKYINGDYSHSLSDKYNIGLELLKEKGVMEYAYLGAPVPSPRILEYRTHAKLSVRSSENCLNSNGESGRFGIGLFKPNSHDVVDIGNCPLHKRAINILIQDIKALLNSSSIEPYDEETNTGDLRYIAVRVSHLTDQLMLTFVLRTEENLRLQIKNLVMELRRKGHKIVACHININAEKTNIIFGEFSKRLIGSDRLRENLFGLSFEIGPTSFFQVNTWQAENLYRRVEQIAGQNLSNDVAWDLYCGTGQIAMLLSKNGYRVLGVEQNPQSIRDAQKNIVLNRFIDPPSFCVGRVEDYLGCFPDWALEPKLIVVNPSRKGLAESVRNILRDKMAGSSNLRLIYVSCDVETLARDLKAIIESGAKVCQVEAFDMFPFTDKMEWIAVLSK